MHARSILLTASLSLAALIACSGNLLSGRDVLIETFDDGLDGCDPFCWSDDCRGGTFLCVEGDLYASHTPNDPCGVSTARIFEGDVTVTARGRTLDGTAFYVGIHGFPTTCEDAYFGGYETNGSTFIKTASGAVSEDGILDDAIDPDADYTVELASVGDAVELRVWPEDSGRPMDPQLRVMDTTFRVGAVAFVFQAGPTAEPEGVLREFRVECDPAPPTETTCDDFRADPDPFDEDPFCWRTFPCCPGEFLASPDGDGLLVRNTAAGATGLVTCESFEKNISVRVTGNFNGNTPGGGAFLSAFVQYDRFVPAGYWCKVRPNGSLVVQRFDGTSAGVTLEGWISLDPAWDVQFELRAIEVGLDRQAIELVVWQGPHDSVSLVLLDSTYPAGSVGFGGHVAGGAPPVLVRSVCVVRRADLPETDFERGDANADGKVDMSDAVFVLDYLFAGGQELSCKKSGDGDDNGSLEVTDAIYLLRFLFLGGLPPPDPYGECGLDATDDGDALGCDSFAPCE
jgi:hypothetical protein